METRTPAAALASLRRRRDVRSLLASLQPSGEGCAIVGGAVRDAFLGRSGGDLDVAAPPGEAQELASSLAALHGVRPLALGRAPHRIFKVPYRRGEIDVWERTGSPEEDLLRRDFTVNALQVFLPDFRLEALPGALEDLGAGRLRPPRPGVFLEDPLRVLRAARFEAELGGFRLVPSALPELRAAAAKLAGVAAERRLSELDRILGAPPPRGASALARLEGRGVLGHLLPGATSPERRRGLALVRRLRAPFPGVARALLLSPLGSARAGDVLAEWKVSRQERRMAVLLWSLPTAPAHGPTRREVASFLRAAGPFAGDAAAFVAARDGARAAAFVAALDGILARPHLLREVLSPRRPATTEEISAWLGSPAGPRLGAALALLDLALAAGEIRGRTDARKLVERFPRD